MSPALAGGFLTTAPPGKPYFSFYFPIFIKQIEDPEEPEPKKVKGSSPGIQDTREAEDGTLEVDEAPEDVIHFCFLPSVELSGGEVFILGKIFVTCISWNHVFSGVNRTINLHLFSCFLCSASLRVEKLVP